MAVQTALDPVADLIDEARRVLPGGSFGNMPADVVLRAGKGGRIWDEHGKEYVDFLLGSGPMFIGHGHPEVTAAVEDAARVLQAEAHVGIGGEMKHEIAPGHG